MAELARVRHWADALIALHLDATVTMMHRDIDRGAEARSKVDMHFHADAGPAFEQAAFEGRFLRFRHSATQ